MDTCPSRGENTCPSRGRQGARVVPYSDFGFCAISPGKRLYATIFSFPNTLLVRRANFKVIAAVILFLHLYMIPSSTG